MFGFCLFFSLWRCNLSDETLLVDMQLIEEGMESLGYICLFFCILCCGYVISPIRHCCLT